MSECNSEIEYSNVGYFDRQTVGDDKVEDPNEWLSVDIGDLLEEEAAAKQQQAQGCNDRTTKGGTNSETRTFVYDACQPSLQENTKEHFQAPGTTVHSDPPSAHVVNQGKSPYTELDEEEMKISFMNFKAGSIALFVPVDASKKVWMAFHSNKPNRFLAQQSLDVFLNRRGKNNDKTRILARIVYIEQHVAGAGNIATNGTKKNDARTTETADASDIVSDSSSGDGRSKQKIGSTRGSAFESVGSDRGSASTVPNSSVVTYESDRNPYNLPPGTVYFECFAEPITVSVAQRKGSA